jgi:hypothetical protein
MNHLKYEDEELFDIFDHLAWCDRCGGFKTDFQRKFQSYLIEKYNYDKSRACLVSNDIWGVYLKRGLIGTFQEYISSKPICMAIVHSFNIRLKEG